MRIFLFLAFSILATSCGFFGGDDDETESSAPAPHSPTDLETPLSRVKDWPERFPGQAMWLALWETDEAREVAWPAVQARLSYLRSAALAEPAWVAVEMSALTPEEQRLAWTEFCTAVEEGDPANRYLIPAAMVREEVWMRNWNSVVNAMTRISAPSEAVLGAAFLQPSTRDIFLPILRAKGMDPNTASPGALAGTLTSAEHAAVSTAVVRRLAEMSEADRRAWLDAVVRTVPEITV